MEFLCSIQWVLVIENSSMTMKIVLVVTTEKKTQKKSSIDTYQTIFGVNEMC